MGRTIVTKKNLPAPVAAPATKSLKLGESSKSIDLPTGLDATSDNYVDRLLKYIPAEVIALWVAMQNFIQGQKGDTNLFLWIGFGICFAAVPLYLWRVSKVSKPLQLIISTLSFAVWVFAIGGPFANLGFYEAYGHMTSGLLLMTFTFAAPLIEPD